MIDSSIVLWGQTLAYTFYVLAIMALMGWFAWRVTQPGESRDATPAPLYPFVALLVFAGPPPPVGCPCRLRRGPSACQRAPGSRGARRPLASTPRRAGG